MNHRINRYLIYSKTFDASKKHSITNRVILFEDVLVLGDNFSNLNLLIKTKLYLVY